MSAWQVLGPHHYRMEDDILNWRPEGEILLWYARGVCELFDRIVARHGYVLWLVDARRSAALGFESRRLYARWIIAGGEKRIHLRRFGGSTFDPAPGRVTA